MPSPSPCSPLAIAVAIFRYRLYDIDVIINRALVYGSLTAMLALVYVGSVVGLQYAFRRLPGVSPSLRSSPPRWRSPACSSPAPPGSAFIDRRFYRRKYDAAKTLEAFGCQAA